MEGKAKITRGSHGLWAYQPIDSTWMLEARLVRQKQTLAIGEVRIVARSRGVHIPGAAPSSRNPVPLGGVPTTVLRGITLGGIRDEIQRAFNDLAKWRDPSMANLYRSMWLADAETAPRRPGRRGRDDSYYAQVAALYVDAVDRQSPRPVADLAEQLGPRLTYGAIVQVIHEARQRELLTDSPKAGRAGGELTEKALQLLGHTAKNATRRRKKK